jgi:hypothetical protein
MSQAGATANAANAAPAAKKREKKEKKLTEEEIEALEQAARDEENAKLVAAKLKEHSKKPDHKTRLESHGHIYTANSSIAQHTRAEIGK